MVAEPVRDPIAQGAVALSIVATGSRRRRRRSVRKEWGSLQNPKVGAASLAISLREQGVSFGFIQSCSQALLPDRAWSGGQGMLRCNGPVEQGYWGRDFAVVVGIKCLAGRNTGSNRCNVGCGCVPGSTAESKAAQADAERGLPPSIS